MIAWFRAASVAGVNVLNSVAESSPPKRVAKDHCPQSRASSVIVDLMRRVRARARPPQTAHYHCDRQYDGSSVRHACASEVVRKDRSNVEDLY